MANDLAREGMPELWGFTVQASEPMESSSGWCLECKRSASFLFFSGAGSARNRIRGPLRSTTSRDPSPCEAAKKPDKDKSDRNSGEQLREVRTYT